MWEYILVFLIIIIVSMIESDTSFVFSIFLMTLLKWVLNFK